MVTHIGASQATFELSVNTQTRSGKRGGKEGGKNKGGAAQSPDQAEGRQGQDKGAAGGAKEEPFR